MVQERKKITIILRIISREILSSRQYECFSTCVPQRSLPKNKKQRGLFNIDTVYCLLNEKNSLRSVAERRNPLQRAFSFFEKYK